MSNEDNVLLRVEDLVMHFPIYRGVIPPAGRCGPRRGWRFL